MKKFIAMAALAALLISTAGCFDTSVDASSKASGTGGGCAAAPYSSAGAEGGSSDTTGE